MPRAIKAPVPTVERVEDTEHMEVEEPAAQQGGRRGSIVISRTDYEFLCGANRRMDRLEQHFGNMEKQFNTQAEVLKAILERLPPTSEASSSVPHGEHQWEDT